MHILPLGNNTLLQSITPSRLPQAAPHPEVLPPTGSGQPSFTRLLTDALDQVNDLQAEANINVQAVAAGHEEALHQTVVAMNKADLALQLTIQVTNRAIEAYKQISQMQI